MQIILLSPLSVKDIWLDDENDLIRSCGALSKVIINITRPKPPSGRQGLAGSWGKDTVRQVHYKMFSMSHFAPTALSSNWILLFKCGYKNSLVITKIPPGTVQNHENPPVNTKNQPTFYFLPSTFYFLLSTFYFLLS